MHASATAALTLKTALERLGARKEEVEWLIRGALGMAEGDGNDPLLVSNALLAYAGIYADRDLELEAEKYVAAAVTRLEEALGPDHPELIEPLSTQALLARALQRKEESTALQQRALELAERTFGPDHPQITDPLKLIGFDALMDGRGADALAAFNRIVAIQDATLGPEHPSTIASQGLRALALAELDRFTEATAVADAAITNMDRSMPELHSSRALTLHNLARVFGMAGDHARAVVTFREVVRIRRAVGHQSTLAAGITGLGGALADNGELDEAQRVLTEAIEIEAKVHADDGMHSTGAVARLADVLRRKGELVRARDLLEPALARIADADDESGQHIDARWQLGRILWELNQDRPRAVALVEQAHDRLAKVSGRMAAEAADEMRAWLESHVVPVAEDPLAD
jgi:tetratricopeptide (TPR) repeat protein